MGFFAKIKTTLTGIISLRSHLKSGTGPVEDVLDEHVKLYRAFTVKRFDVFSRGGGNWPKIKPSRAKKKGHAKILVDTKFIRLHLSDSIQVIKKSGLELTLGFQSYFIHPNAKMPLDLLESIHDQGLGNNPKREILVDPDQSLEEKRIKATRKILTDFLNGQ